MTYNSRLFTETRLRLVVETTDDMANTCGEIADALADYENAAELSGSERTEAREEARDEAWAKIGELLALADTLRRQRDSLYPDAKPPVTS